MSVRERTYQVNIQAEYPLSPGGVFALLPAFIFLVGTGSPSGYPCASVSMERRTLCVRLYLAVEDPVFLEDKAINNNRSRDDLFINEQIRDREVRLIGADGQQVGVVSIAEARRMAEEAELDLVKIAPGARPPVCRIMDYGKYKYEKTRKEKDARKKQHMVEIKEIRMSPNIDTNDLQTKINAARKFLSKGDRVKVTLRFRGREMAHMQANAHILTDFAAALADVAVVDKAPKVEGRTLTLFLAAKK